MADEVRLMQGNPSFLTMDEGGAGKNDERWHHRGVHEYLWSWSKRRMNH